MEPDERQGAREVEWDLDEPNSPLRGILGGGGFSMARDAEGKLKKGGGVKSPWMPRTLWHNGRAKSLC